MSESGEVINEKFVPMRSMIERANSANYSTDGISDRISTIQDQNGSPFMMNSSGSIDFGMLKNEDGVKAGPMRISFGDAGNGYVHTEQRHGEQIRKAGYRNVLDFVEYVAKNYTRVIPGKEYKSENGGVNKTYLVQLVDEHNNTLYVQLSRDGSYWNINSAGILRKSYPKVV